MFAKDNSSLYGTGTKKGKEVTLRKSDRRNLRKLMYETLLLPNDNKEQKVNDIIDNNNKSILHHMIDDICLQGSNIVQRQFVYTPEYKKVTIYLKSPSTSSSSSSSSDNNNDSSSSFNAWPFTVHSQAIWMELDVSATETLQVPTVALLGVLHHALQQQTQQQPQSSSSSSLFLLPTIAVPSAVSKNLCRGAHLMRAGMFAMPNPPLPTVDPDVAVKAAKLLQTTPKQSRLVALVVQSSELHQEDNDNDTTMNSLLQLQQQPFAVGLLHPAIQSIQDIGPGTKGIGVEILTCYGDDFWRQQQTKTTASRTTKTGGIMSSSFDAGQYGNVGFVNGEYVVPIRRVVKETLQEKEEVEENGSTTADGAAVEPKKSASDDNENDTVNAGSSVQEAITNKDDSERCNDNNDNSNGYDATTEQQYTKEDSVGVVNDDDDDNETSWADTTTTPHVMTPDEVLHEAVCRALVALNPPKRFLPMQMSIFYANHVLKHKPPGTMIELKKTRYKKFGTYIQEQVSRKLIEAGPSTTNGSGSGGSNNSDPLAMLTGYDRRHDDLKSLILESKESAAAAAAVSNTDDNSRQRQKLVLVDLYRVPIHFVSLLRLDTEAVNAAQATSVERRNTGYLTGKEVREILEDYIARENLVDATNKGSVHLDGPLTDALYPSSKKQSKAAADITASSPPPSSPPATLSRKDLVTKWQLKMQDAYALVQMPGNVIIQMNRGKPPQVTITVTKRQNRKFITRVRGIEYYGVNAMQFKNDVSHRLACAASIEDSPMEKLPNKDHVELVFQGNIHEELQAMLLNDSSLSSHGGLVSVGDSDDSNNDYYYQLPKNSINVILRKGVPGHKK